MSAEQGPVSIAVGPLDEPAGQLATLPCSRCLSKPRVERPLAEHEKAGRVGDRVYEPTRQQSWNCR
jgi:hypothetical protein